MFRLFSRGLMVAAGIASIQVAVPPGPFSGANATEHRPDPRLKALRRFFGRFDCPAIEYAEEFLSAADRYALDWRLLPSISYVESSGGKSAPYNNLFGWDSGRAQFSSAPAGIHEVGYRLANSSLYRNKDLDGLLATYNPNAEYAQKVKSVMLEIARIQ